MKKGKYQDQKFGTSAAPISKKVSEAIEKGTINLDNEEELDVFIKGLQNIQENQLGRAVSLNLLNINNGKNTIEFRVANGSINPDTWIENVRLFGRIVQISENLAQIQKKDQRELTEEDKKLLNLMEQLKEKKIEREKMEVLLEMLFIEEERIVYRERYDENCRLLEEASKKEKNPIEKLEFVETVNFHRKEEFLGIAMGSREGYKIVMEETIGIREPKDHEKGE